MAYSSGVFSLYTPGNPTVTGTTIASDWANNTLNDIATGLSTAMLKDGSQVLTANIPFANFKITGLGAGSALTDSATLRQVQYGFGAFLTSVAGTNTITGTATPTPAYTVGQLFTFIPAVTNTGATTLNISSVGAGAVQWAGAALTGGELVAGTAYTVYVTAVTPVFEIVGATQFPDTRALVVGGTDATKKFRVEVDELTTGNTRVLTMADQDIDLGTTQAEADAGTAGKALISGLNKLSLGTPIATTSGTAHDFTGIPAGVRRITISFQGVSLSGTDNLLVQIGDAGGIDSSGYLSSSGRVVSAGATLVNTSTASFIITGGNAAYIFSGHMTLTLLNSSTFLWVSSHSVKNDTGTTSSGGGNYALSAELTQIRITRDGTDTFDAGSVNIIYER